MRWLIASPAWGPRYVRLFIEFTLPAIRAALGDREARFLIHTDQPNTIAEAMGDTPYVTMQPDLALRTHVTLGHAHRDALRVATPGEAVAYINADMIPSVEVFAAAERRFVEGKRCIMMAATRTIGGIPPIGAPSADLLLWTMTHVHPAVQECFWERGRTGTPWAIYFARGTNVVCHGFHLHPFAVLSDEYLWFNGKTIDVDLLQRFTPDQVHVVTSSEEAAFAELSPPERVFALLKWGQTISVKSIVHWAKRAALQHHRYLFQHRISIVGNGKDVGEDHIVELILRILGNDDLLARRHYRSA